ncbi:MAG: NAD-dependent epimerase/dehydratase [Deltaproteobacteria bacterium]|nr:NAD-dependent epimerase/dehydratase [Deltaproteobacteria bacterium]
MIPAFLGLILAYLLAERIRHEKRLGRIPIRIHVNGTRGKSDVTRRIAAALRHSGIRTLAKTTGTLPKLILPDGSEETIRRRAPANILEQMKVVQRADRLNAQAIVVECMALDPDLQFVSEAAMIRSTVGVITNVRPDHFEAMGGCLDDVAESLSRTVPAGGVLVIGDRRYFPLFSEVASRKGSRVVLAGDSGPAGDPSTAGDCFFPENIEIARCVCSLLGLDPAAAAPSADDPVAGGEGAAVFRVPFGGRTVHFLDAFAANDAESTRILQERVFARKSFPKPWIALFNNRADRPLRMKSFAEDLLAGSPYDLIAVTGEGRRLAHRYLRERVQGKEVVLLPGDSPDRLMDELMRDADWKECTIVGMGNEKGGGERVSRFFRERGAR